MKIIYTKHAEQKLQRADIKKFKINKRTIREILLKPYKKTKTKYDDFAALGILDTTHIVRVVYVIINSSYKIITFHVARKNRYEN